LISLAPAETRPASTPRHWKSRLRDWESDRGARHPVRAGMGDCARSPHHTWCQSG